MSVPWASLSARSFTAALSTRRTFFEIDGEAARFLFQYAQKDVDMYSWDPAAYEQHHEIFSANDSAASATHLWALGSILLFL